MYCYAFDRQLIFGRKRDVDLLTRDLFSIPENLNIKLFETIFYIYPISLLDN